ncbi:MAG TPA: hypothetical protein VK770_02575 [Candidatus Acidoferrum sp.]|jgi:hypothetical protein|nr:hypothetical protein [Candidatus Acidoferrum sp.]
MISKAHLFAAALAGVLICSVAGAQVRNVASSVRRPAGQTRPPARVMPNSTRNSRTAPQSSPSASVIQISPSGRNATGFTADANSFIFDGNSGVPGLGFDFPHLAAISGAFRNNPSVRFRHNDFRGQGSFVPILFGGYPYYYDDSSYDQPEQPPVQQPQPQIIVIQQPVPAQHNAETEGSAGNPSASPSAPQADEPIPDVGNFILVRRDGRILFASVFSVVGSQLQYVTPEGIRRTLPISDLDADATQQMNEARGTTVQIHN